MVYFESSHWKVRVPRNLLVYAMQANGSCIRAWATLIHHLGGSSRSGTVPKNLMSILRHRLQYLGSKKNELEEARDYFGTLSWAL